MIAAARVRADSLLPGPLGTNALPLASCPRHLRRPVAALGERTLAMSLTECRMMLIRPRRARRVPFRTRIGRLEAGAELKPRTVEAVQGAFEAAGVEFTNGGGPA